ncbi:MAG: ankyrin repeat domain-containing protein [Flavobacteriaceae bacterium]
MAACLCIVNINAKTSSESFNNNTTVTTFKVSAFCLSIVKGDYDTVKKLVDLGTDVNSKSNGMTPAMYAAKFNRAEILELLIANGANLKVRSDQGWTAKKYAELSNANEAVSVIENALTKR